MTWLKKRTNCKTCRGTGFVLGDTFADQCPTCKPANDKELMEAIMHEQSFMTLDLETSVVIDLRHRRA